MTAYRRTLLALAIAMLGFVAHASSLNYGFVFDERILITENPAVHDLANLRPILVEKFWPGPIRGVYYRPAITLSYAINYAMAEDQPWIYHLTNVLAHAGACVVICLLLIKLLRRESVALVAAVIFAIHPVHAESVTWIPGRTDVFATLFMASAWLALLYRRDAGNAAAKVALTAALWALTLFALGAKEIAVALPLLIIAGDLLLGERGWKKLWPSWLEVIVLTTIMLGLRSRALTGPGGDPAPDPLAGLAPLDWIGKVCLIIGTAARELVFPRGWRIDYAYENAIVGAPAWQGLISGAFIAALILAVALLWKKKPALSFAALGFLISMLPVSHLIPFPTAFAERFLYLPSLFAALALGALIASLIPGDAKTRRARFPIPAISIGALLVCAIIAYNLARARPFKDDLGFWNAAVESAPELASAHHWLGLAYRDRGMLGKARDRFQTAIRLDPDHHVSAMHLAEMTWRLGDREEAVRMLERLVRKSPDPKSLFNLGLFYRQLGRADEAAQCWEKVLLLDPGDVSAHSQLVFYYLTANRECKKARAHLQAIKQYAPGSEAVKVIEQKLISSCGQ